MGLAGFLGLPLEASSKVDSTFALPSGGKDEPRFSTSWPGAVQPTNEAANGVLQGKSYLRLLKIPSWSASSTADLALNFVTDRGRG